MTAKFKTVLRVSNADFSLIDIYILSLSATVFYSSYLLSSFDIISLRPFRSLLPNALPQPIVNYYNKQYLKDYNPDSLCLFFKYLLWTEKNRTIHYFRRNRYVSVCVRDKEKSKCMRLGKENSTDNTEKVKGKVSQKESERHREKNRQIDR